MKIYFYKDYTLKQLVNGKAYDMPWDTLLADDEFYDIKDEYAEAGIALEEYVPENEDGVTTYTYTDEAGAVLVEFGQLKIEFEDLPEGTASAAVSINGVTNTFPIKDGYATVSRMHLKVGVMQVRVHITDNSGKLTQVILCESVYISSTHNQVQEPLLAYPNLGDILERIAATEQALSEAKAAYESKVSELEEQLAEINANYTEAISRLDNIQKSWDIYGIYENNEDKE